MSIFNITSVHIKNDRPTKSDRADFSTDNRGRKAYFIVAKTGANSVSAIFGAKNPLA